MDHGSGLKPHCVFRAKVNSFQRAVKSRRRSISVSVFARHIPHLSLSPYYAKRRHRVLIRKARNRDRHFVTSWMDIPVS